VRWTEVIEQREEQVILLGHLQQVHGETEERQQVQARQQEG
jgi:hypothetical protein